MIILNLVEYKDGTWGFVGRIPNKYRILCKDPFGHQMIDSIRFKNKNEASEAVLSVLSDGYDVQIFKAYEKL